MSHLVALEQHFRILNVTDRSGVVDERPAETHEVRVR